MRNGQSAKTNANTCFTTRAHVLLRDASFPHQHTTICVGGCRIQGQFLQTEPQCHTCSARPFATTTTTILLNDHVSCTPQTQLHATATAAPTLARAGQHVACTFGPRLCAGSECVLASLYSRRSITIRAARHSTQARSIGTNGFISTKTDIYCAWRHVLPCAARCAVTRACASGCDAGTKHRLRSCTSGTKLH